MGRPEVEGVVGEVAAVKVEEASDDGRGGHLVDEAPHRPHLALQVELVQLG